MIANKKIVAGALLIACATVLIDQYSKWFVLYKMALPHRPPIEVTSFFNLVMVWNHGISFGMFSAQRMPEVLIALASMIVAILLVWLAKATDRLTMLGIGLVVGGAVGNIIDRLQFGAVADFLDFHAFGVHWPAFNIADSSIFIGVVVLCIESMIRPGNKA